MTDSNATNPRANNNIKQQDGGATKRWWERTTPDQSKDVQPQTQETQTAPLRRPNAPATRPRVEVEEYDELPTAPAAAKPVMSGTRSPEATVPSGAAGIASKKRWWESKDAPVDAVNEPDEDPVAAPPRANVFNRPTGDPARNTPQRTPPQEREQAFPDLAPPQEVTRPSASVARPAARPLPVEEAELPVAPKAPRAFGRPAAAPAPMLEDDDDDFEPVVQRKAAPQAARGKNIFGSPRPEPVFEDEDEDEDEEPAFKPPPKAAKRGGLFGRKAKPVFDDAAEMAEADEGPAPEPMGGIPAPRRGSVESKKGPKAGMPNNVFARSQNNMFAKTQKAPEHKAPVIPKGPPKMPFDQQDGSKQQQRTVAARKRRASMRGLKGSIGKIAGPFAVLAACAALVATGIVNVSFDNGFDVKVNWPDQLKPAVSKVETVMSEQAVPVLGKVKDSVGTLAKPLVDQASEVFTIPTPTPSAGDNYNFSKEKIKP